jgi:hypothetical protein
MSATLMERDRPDIPQDRAALRDLRRKLQEESDELPPSAMEDLRRFFVAASGYVSYSGPFEIGPVNVQHNVAFRLAPQWVGTTLSRAYTFERGGDRLNLTADMGEATDHLVWDRLA